MTADRSLEMKRTAAPFLWRDVGERLREVPAVAMEVLGVVLALAVGLIGRLGQDDRAVLPRTLAVTFGVLNPDLDDV
jgi:hypothetical protein